MNARDACIQALLHLEDLEDLRIFAFCKGHGDLAACSRVGLSIADLKKIFKQRLAAIEKHLQKGSQPLPPNDTNADADASAKPATTPAAAPSAP